MAKCKNCYPAGEVDCRYCTEVATANNDEIMMGDPMTCEEKVFPGFDFCPKHLADRGLNLTKLTADYIANKEK